jgi:HD-GYP domain-containing protein (c-di-GMP phosphodiesterase class II)
LGIPESILRKSGTLTDEEWKVIRTHPQIAYDLLSPIVYLHPALDIPYYHHEKWDGSGYPQGLKGNQTPLAARIFAVVDVWDALISDRPFRKAWSDKQASDYLREQAGSRFDPQIVAAFLNAEIKKKVTKTFVR